LQVVEHCRPDIGTEPGRNELRSDTYRPRHSSIWLFPAFAALGEADQPGSKEHADVKVQVAGVHAEPLGKLAVGEVTLLALTEHFEDAKSQRMAKRLQLLRPIDREDVE
jgi:hypothetical protein